MKFFEFKNFYFSARLAWRQLRYEKTKTLAAIVGIIFATILVFMQLGFKESLFRSAASVPRRLKGDLFLLHKQTNVLWQAIKFPRYELFRAYGHPAVREVKTLYTSILPWKNPEKKNKNSILIFAFDPREIVIDNAKLLEKQHLLTQKDTALFDECSRANFGPIKELLKNGPVETEISDKKIRVLGSFRLGTSFAAGGNIVMSEESFFSLCPTRVRRNMDVGIICLNPGENLLEIQKDLKNFLNPVVSVFTKEELVAHEEKYWRKNSPISFIFGFGMAMALVVGMIVVYQILFTDITNHLSEYATLKAVGFPQGYFVETVVSSSLILACIGFFPGMILSFFLYRLAESKIFIEMYLTGTEILWIFFLILVMCILSGLLALNRLRAANPADLF